MGKKLSLEEISEDNPRLKAFLDGTFKEPPNVQQVEFFLCLVFQSDNQMLEFLSKLPKNVKTLDNCYVDGEELANAVGIKLAPVKVRATQGVDPRKKKIALRR